VDRLAEHVTDLRWEEEVSMRTHLRRLAALLGALTLVGALAASAEASGGEIIVPRHGTIQIAVVLPHTGGFAATGASARNAVQMAVEKRSKIKGHRIQVNDFDGPCGPGSPANATAAAQVVQNAQNLGVVGHFCSFGYGLALPIYQGAGVASVTGSATYPALHSFGPSVFNSVVVPDPAAEDWYAAVQKTETDAEFRAEYQERFGTPPAPFADLYYDATSILLAAIRHTATRISGGRLSIDRAALATTLRATAGFKGVTCTITLTSQGWRVNDPAALSRCTGEVDEPEED
jgi:ABC-type branched-subunit amino acid transport system substrate-binding protein